MSIYKKHLSFCDLNFEIKIYTIFFLQEKYAYSSKSHNNMNPKFKRFETYPYMVYFFQNNNNSCKIKSGLTI